MRVIAVHDRAALGAFLGKNPYRNAYALGDLDNFFWPYTQWYGLADDADALRAVALVYMAPGDPVVHAVPADADEHTAQLVDGIIHLLPRRAYAHLTPYLLERFESAYHVEHHGLHHKMALKDHTPINAMDVSAVVQLYPHQQAALRTLYDDSYPGNWFDPRMLETGQYFGVWHEGRLISVAGIHVYSRAYGVAALGNVTTHPDHRGRGLATMATAALCRSLRESVTHIGLNVHAANTTAIHTYERLGFMRVADYGEYTLTSGG